MEATAIDTARSLWIIYQQMSPAVQNEFKRIISDEEIRGAGYKNAEWLPLSEPSLHELWNAPEEDYWDELYAKQHPAN